eukprot:10003040-Lingulodinium_polyedra.AAC.1
MDRPWARHGSAVDGPRLGHGWAMETNRRFGPAGNSTTVAAQMPADFHGPAGDAAATMINITY